jgi:hypothetical protein
LRFASKDVIGRYIFSKFEKIDRAPPGDDCVIPPTL